MTITADELKHLTRLNSAIAAKKWTHAYAHAAVLGNEWPRVTRMAEHQRLSSPELSHMLYADSK